MMTKAPRYSWRFCIETGCWRQLPFFVEKKMPRRPDTPCKHPGCAALVPYGQKYCSKHKGGGAREKKAQQEQGYDGRWRKARKRFLSIHPFCVRCLEEKKMTKATVVDHIVPHRGDRELFWDESNWQPLCKRHHDRKTMTEDRYQEFHY